MLMRGRPAQGFTLIELMVTVVIAGILMALAMPSMLTWLQSSQVRTATESIRDGLQFARGEAIRLNAPVTFNLTGPDSSWTVNDASNAILQQKSGRDGSANAVVSWLSPAPTAATLPIAITFNSLGQTSLNATAWIQITNPTGGSCVTTSTSGIRCLNVTITSGGQARICDPSISTPVGDNRIC